MTPEEQQQVNAAMEHMRQMVGKMAVEGANMAAVAEELAHKLKAAQERIAELEKPDNVIPMKEPA